MGILISFLRWLDNLVTTALKWMVEAPGKLVIFVTTFISTLLEAFSLLSTHISTLTTSLNSASSSVGAFGSAIGQHHYGALLVHCLALDRAYSYIVSTAGIFCALVGGLFIALFAYVCTAWVIPMALQLVQKLISIFSAGFVKT